MDFSTLIPLLASTGLVLASAVFLLFELYATIIGHMKGAPFVKSGKKNILAMLDLAKIAPGEKIVDLGSGDGALCIEAARKGATAIGIEINPFLVRISRWRAKRAGVAERASFLKENFWNYPLGDINVVLLYLWPETLERLKDKLGRELVSGSRVVSNNFPIKGWTPVAEKNHVYLYRT